jgi:hypothetical protein
MKGDFTRNTFNKENHFSRVLMQQGRVQLDADWNEQSEILLHYLRTLAADLIGPHGGPKDGCGFSLVPPNGGGPNQHPGRIKAGAISESKQIDFNIFDGHYYVDGLLCENDRNITYHSQDNYPLPDNLQNGKIYLVYLDVWERHITALEEGTIREVALGGPDTATRTKVVWQVKVTDKLADSTNNILPEITSKAGFGKSWLALIQIWQAKAHCKLKVQLDHSQAYTDPCNISPDSKYCGKENQLYRVEIHQGSAPDKQPTFKWSRDNGSIAAAWLDNSEDGGLIVSCGRGFAVGQWIEITIESDDLLAQPGEMVKLVKVEGDTLYPDSDSPLKPWAKGKKVRRWDQVENEDITLQGGSVPIKEDENWINMENGIQVQFQAGGIYRTGDYWLIPARTNGTIEWLGVPDGVSPHGIQHHYAPLWIISTVDKGKVKPIIDLRKTFGAMAT